MPTLMLHFNPRTHTGCDYIRILIYPAILLFQSTHPYRVRRLDMSDMSRATTFQSTHPYRVRRRGLRQVAKPIAYFNPRTHTGCDIIRFVFSFPWEISIHAPIQGATYLLQTAKEIADISIHAPIQGATFFKPHNLTVISKFQSTHPYRVRPRYLRQS